MLIFKELDITKFILYRTTAKVDYKYCICVYRVSRAGKQQYCSDNVTMFSSPNIVVAKFKIGRVPSSAMASDLTELNCARIEPRRRGSRISFRDIRAYVRLTYVGRLHTNIP